MPVIEVHNEPLDYLVEFNRKLNMVWLLSMNKDRFWEEEFFIQLGNSGAIENEVRDLCEKYGCGSQEVFNDDKD